MKRLLIMTLALVFVVTLSACGSDDPAVPTTEQVTRATSPILSLPTEEPTVPSEPEPTETVPTEPPATDPTGPTLPAPDPDRTKLICNGREYAMLDALMEDLAADGTLEQPSHTVTIQGLKTDVVLEMSATHLDSITAFGYTVRTDTKAWDDAHLYGDVVADIYDYEDMVILNIWEHETGYTILLMPTGSWSSYPSDGRSTMVYKDASGALRGTQTATKFNAVSQWDTAPIDLASSRDDLYFSTGHVQIVDGEVRLELSREYTIGEVFDLDAIFAKAKDAGYYPEYETLDQLLAQNLTDQTQG